MIRLASVGFLTSSCRTRGITCSKVDGGDEAAEVCVGAEKVLGGDDKVLTFS